MRRRIPLTLPVIVLLFGATFQTVWAQNTRVAVIDVTQVFDNHLRLKQQLEELSKEVSEFEAFVRRENEQLQKMAEQLKEIRPGTEQYRSTEKQLASTQADLQVRDQGAGVGHGQGQRQAARADG